MNKCQDCGLIFSEPRKNFDRHGFSYGLGEEYYACPRCGGGYDELVECQLCGNDFVNNSDILDKPYCPECREKLIEKFEKLMAENFDEEEIQAIKILMED